MTVPTVATAKVSLTRAAIAEHLGGGIQDKDILAIVILPSAGDPQLWVSGTGADKESSKYLKQAARELATQKVRGNPQVVTSLRDMIFTGDWDNYTVSRHPIPDQDGVLVTILFNR